jgi:hypothetical protein
MVMVRVMVVVVVMVMAEGKLWEVRKVFVC